MSDTSYVITMPAFKPIGKPEESEAITLEQFKAAMKEARIVKLVDGKEVAHKVKRDDLITAIYNTSNTTKECSCGSENLLSFDEYKKFLQGHRKSEGDAKDSEAFDIELKAK